MIDVEVIKTIVKLRVSEIFVKLEFYDTWLVLSPNSFTLIIISDLLHMQNICFSIEEIAEGDENHQQKGQ